MFTKLKQITDTELKTKAVDCVIGVRTVALLPAGSMMEICLGALLLHGYGKTHDARCSTDCRLELSSLTE